MTRIVIAGAGLAGLRAAQAARAAGHEGELVVVGDERHPPYTRPPLSKELLSGAHSAEQTMFPGLDMLQATWRLSTAVTGLDPDARTLTLADGEALAYDRLIVATGVRARRLPGIGPEVHTLRDLDDAARLLARLGEATRVAIVGAGFIGCEVAASVRDRGVEVDLIDQLPLPLAPIGSELGARVAQLHRAHGVALHLGVGVRDVHADGVTLDDDTRIDADVVLVAIGAQPNTEWATGIERAGDGAIVCDATLTSVSHPDVLAAGDVVSWPHPNAGGERIRVEHWTTAAEHGRVAGANATREPAQRTAHVTPPYFWSDQYDCKIQVVGIPTRGDRIEIVDSDEAADPPRLVAEAHDGDGELVGAIAFNNARRLAEYRRRLVGQPA